MPPHIHLVAAAANTDANSDAAANTDAIDPEVFDQEVLQFWADEDARFAAFYANIDAHTANTDANTVQPSEANSDANLGATNTDADTGATNTDANSDANTGAANTHANTGATNSKDANTGQRSWRGSHAKNW